MIFKRFSESIVLKNAIVYIVLIALTALMTAFLIYKSTAEKIKVNSKQQLKHTAVLIQTTFDNFIENVHRDIMFLSNNPLVDNYIQNDGLKNKDYNEGQLIMEFVALLKSKPEYAQIRLIGNADHGKELIRVEKMNQDVKVISKVDLQIKGDREYYIETKNMKNKSIYFSAIDLNKERGVIAYPKQATFRTAIPLHLRDSFYGMVVINVDLRLFFEKLKTIAGPDYQLYLFNNYRHFLVHPQDSLTFAFEYGKQVDFNQYVPSNVLDTNQDRIIGTDKIQLIKKLYFPKEGYELYFALTSNLDILQATFIKWKWNILILTLICILISFIVASLMMYRQSNEIKKITKSLLSFENNIDHQPIIDVDRKDEIGQLAQSFLQMSAKIKSHVNELSHARELAEQANMDKEEFLENMSHEMRNPLQSIIGTCRMLEQHSPKPEQKIFIDTLSFSAHQLLSLVNDVLDFKKLQLGKIQLVNKPENLKQLMNTIIASHQFGAMMKKVKLQLLFADIAEGEYVSIDSLRFSQVVNNLIDNAIKFSNDGDLVCVRLNKLRVQDRDVLQCSIEDNGIGIAKDQVEKIKSRYVSLEGQQNRIGSGIGLHVVTNILNLYESNLEIESELNKGSKFTFRIANLIFQNMHPAENPVSVNKPLWDSLRTVVSIDDDLQIQFWLEHFFESRNVAFRSFADHDDFLKDSFNQFDLIISDFNFDKSIIDNSIIDAYRMRLSNHGLLMLLSGQDLLSNGSNKPSIDCDAFVLKPISDLALETSIADAVMQKFFDSADLTIIAADYDYDPIKVESVMQLYIDDWSKLLERLERCMIDRDINEFDRVYHRMISSLRKLKMNRTISYLDTWKHDESNYSNVDNKHYVAKIKFAILYYIDRFRNYHMGDTN